MDVKLKEKTVNDEFAIIFKEKFVSKVFMHYITDLIIHVDKNYTVDWNIKGSYGILWKNVFGINFESDKIISELDSIASGQIISTEKLFNTYFTPYEILRFTRKCLYSACNLFDINTAKKNIKNTSGSK